MHLLWERLEDAAWDQDADRLTVTEVGAYGRPRPAYAFDLADPGLLLQLVRERVTASIVLQQHVPVRGNRGVTVIGRRSPAGGPVAWMHAFDPGVDPADPEVAEVADTWVDEDDDATRVRGVGEPVGLLPARRRGVADENAEPESALPPLQPAPPPPIPPGTSLVVVDDDELDLHDLGTSARAPHRSAVGE